MVCVNGSELSEVLMLYGVFQGSILGFLFFILFINDLFLYISVQLDFYVDDMIVIVFVDVKNLVNLSLLLNKFVFEI